MSEVMLPAQENSHIFKLIWDNFKNIRIDLALTIGAMVLGIGIVIIATRVEHIKPWHEVIRDIGIAFLVSGLVGLMYEIYVRSLHDSEKMKTLFSVYIKDYLPEDVWEELKEVIQKSMIRRSVDVRIKLQRDPSLQGDQAVLWMALNYYLHGLKAKPAQVKVHHLLDYHIPNQAKDLPRFERITVGAEVYEGPKLANIVKDGEVVLDVSLEPRTGAPLRISTERYELIYTPGSYNFAMTELAHGVTFEFLSFPSDVEPDVNLKLHTDHSRLTKEGSKWQFNGIMLPGQSFEIRFKRKEVLSTASIVHGTDINRVNHQQVAKTENAKASSLLSRWKGA